MSKPAAFEVVEAEALEVVSIVLVCWVVDVFVEVEVLSELVSVKKGRELHIRPIIKS